MPGAQTIRHAPSIATNVATRANLAGFAERHAGGFALASLAITTVGTVAAVVMLTTGAAEPPEARQGLVDAILTFVPYGLAGAVLISRRPDLPFGWLLAAASTGCPSASLRSCPP